MGHYDDGNGEKYLNPFNGKTYDVSRGYRDVHTGESIFAPAPAATPRTYTQDDINGIAFVVAPLAVVTIIGPFLDPLAGFLGWKPLGVILAVVACVLLYTCVRFRSAGAAGLVLLFGSLAYYAWEYIPHPPKYSKHQALQQTATIHVHPPRPTPPDVRIVIDDIRTPWGNLPAGTEMILYSPVEQVGMSVGKSNYKINRPDCQKLHLNACDFQYALPDSLMRPK